AWNAAAAVKPLQWNIYYDRAMLKLRLGRPHTEALQDFSRWRQLEKKNAELCAREFDFWLDYDPVLGVAALREALRRDPTRAKAYYEQRLWRMTAYPELRPHFLAMAESDAKLALAFLHSATPEEFSLLLD